MGKKISYAMETPGSAQAPEERTRSCSARHLATPYSALDADFAGLVQAVRECASMQRPPLPLSETH